MRTAALSALSLLLAALTASAEEPRELDAGTWVRKSLSILPVVVGECPNAAIEREAREHYKVDIVPHLMRAPLEDRARARAREVASACELVRSSFVDLGDRYTGLTSMQRFDRNSLPEASQLRIRTQFLSYGSTGIREFMTAEIGDTLRTLLAQAAFGRSGHLAADYQKNSFVSDKAKSQDVTDEELGLLRKAAYVFAMRATHISVHKVNDTTWRGEALLELGGWSFDPVAKSFEEVAFLSDRREKTGRTPGEVAGDLRDWTIGIRSTLLRMPDFRFTSQITSLEGNILRPASSFKSNTEADLEVHRRFRYIENQAGKGGQLRRTRIGYGYLDRIDRRDSTYRLRHIGGSSPYQGLELEEIPGTTWGLFSFSLLEPDIAGWGDTLERNGSGERIDLRRLGRISELRFGVRTNLPGDPVHHHFALDIPVFFGGASGNLNYREGHGGDGDSTYTSYQKDLAVLLGAGLEIGWAWRYDIRRLMLTTGLSGGLRFHYIGLDDEEVYDIVGSRRSRLDPPEDALKLDGVEGISRLDGYILGRAGLQFSINENHGLGLEAAYEVLRARGGWDHDTDEKGEWVEVPGRKAGPGRLRLSVQWIFG